MVPTVVAIGDEVEGEVLVIELMFLLLNAITNQAREVDKIHREYPNLKQISKSKKQSKIKNLMETKANIKLKKSYRRIKKGNRLKVVSLVYINEDESICRNYV